MYSPWRDRIASIGAVVFETRNEAFEAEAEAIRTERPEHNINMCDSGGDYFRKLAACEAKKKKRHPLVAEAISRCGGAGLFCREIGISRQALHQWGDDLPELRRYQIEKMIERMPQNSDVFAPLRRKLRFRKPVAGGVE
jgi:hypothetical protein